MKDEKTQPRMEHRSNTDRFRAPSVCIRGSRPAFVSFAYFVVYCPSFTLGPSKLYVLPIPSYAILCRCYAFLWHFYPFLCRFYRHSMQSSEPVLLKHMSLDGGIMRFRISHQVNVNDLVPEPPRIRPRAVLRVLRAHRVYLPDRRALPNRPRAFTTGPNHLQTFPNVPNHPQTFQNVPNTVLNAVS
jgi:hypothetical protein